MNKSSLDEPFIHIEQIKEDTRQPIVVLDVEWCGETKAHHSKKFNAEAFHVVVDLTEKGRPLAVTVIWMEPE